MGSIPDPFPSADSTGGSGKDTGRRLPIVAEEDILARVSDDCLEDSHCENDDSGYGARPGPAKRQRRGFSCEACHMTFTEKRALARHKKTDHHRKQVGLPPDRRHACIMCGKYFTRGHDLKRHQNEQHPDPATDVPSLPVNFSSGSSGSNSQQTSDKSSSARSISQASSATDDTSIYATAEASSDGSSAPTEFFDAKLGHSPGDIVTEGRRVLRHFRSEPNINTHNLRHARHTDLSDIEDREEFGEDAKPCPSSDCGRDALSSDLDQMPASARQLPLTFPADAELLKKLPTKPFDISSWQTTMCVLCGVAFEDDSDELLKHLRRHLDSFKGQYRCGKCQIDFVHEQDLQRHLQSAAKGHCGFSFPHACTGHHPPVPGDRLGGFSDFDRARLCVRLQNWEQAQLQAYIAEIGELTTTRPKRRLIRWSEVLRGGSCRGSFASFAVSVKSNVTAPYDSTAGKPDIGGLSKRLQQMSLGSAGAKVRRLILPETSDVHTRTIDRSLRKAIKHLDITRIQNLLDMGADPHILHQCKGPFVAVALWGLGHVASILTEHRLGEDIVGSCSVCNIGTDRFEMGYNKVEALLRHNADPDAPGGLCGHPLATAAWMGQPDIVRLLLAAGAGIRHTRGRHGTALCAAAAQTGYLGQKDVVRLLIQHGADVHDRGPEGTALEVARQRRDYWLVKSMNVGHSDDGLRARISCCDEVIAILEVKENEPFKRFATQPLGDVVREQVVGSAESKVAWNMGRQRGLRKMQSWTTM